MANIQEKIDSSNIERQNRNNILSFTFLHFMNDLHSTSLPTIIPMLVNSISMSMSQAGLLSGLFGMTNILGQPISGYFADRLKRPWFAIWGPCLSVFGACMLPLAPNYAAALLFVGCISTGTALFHPQGTGRAGSAAGIKNLAFFISMFAAFGSLGSAIGPLYVVYMISLLGKKGFPFMLLPILLICLWLWKKVGGIQEDKILDIPYKKGSIPDFLCNIRHLLSKIGNVVFIASVRDATFQSIKLFMPMLIVINGGSIKAGGFSLFALTMASTIAGVIGGRLADTVGDKKVLIISVSISPILLITGLNLSGLLSLCTLMIGIALLEASAPVTTAMAQKRCPESRSSASSLSMGVSWGIANLFATPVGILADLIGLQATLQIIAFLPWVVTAWYIWKTLSAKNSPSA
ncbi:MAG: MFS transporter [Synergistaceae bacterium]|nr:MFS transporter [Synergistaceae bacterium]